MSRSCEGGSFGGTYYASRPPNAPDNVAALKKSEMRNDTSLLLYHAVRKKQTPGNRPTTRASVALSQALLKHLAAVTST